MSSLASTFVEREVAFWASYLIAVVCTVTTQIIIFLKRKDFGQSIPIFLIKTAC
jgi:hypothetical protein